MTTSFAQQPNPHGMPLWELCQKAGIICPQELHITVRGITSDSRRVKDGYLFVALKGRRQNGEDFISDACRAGAVAVVVEGKVPTPWPYDAVCLPVENAREVLAYLCDAWYHHPGEKLRLVGITGTNGKTSVAAMLTHILRHAGIPCGVMGTVGNISPVGEPIAIYPSEETAHMTTPDPEELYQTLYLMTKGTPRGEKPIVVMEVTSHALALYKTAPLNFEVGIFTNLTPEHLDFHLTMEDYFKAKRKLFASTRKAVINADDAYGKRLLTDTALSVEKYYLCHADPTAMGEDVCMGEGKRCCRIYACQVAYLGVDGVEYRLLTPTARFRIQCTVPGEFSIKNSMQAVISALILGVSPGKIQNALATFPGVSGRMERVLLPSHIKFSVFLDYAHTPDAIENLLLTARKLKRRRERVVILFGCGGDRDASKRAMMAKVASRLADMVIITSDNSRTEDKQHIIEDIMAGMNQDCAHTVIPDREKAIEYAIRYARSGDIILLAGKGHETYEIDQNGQRPFCERDIVISSVKRFHPYT